MLNARSEVFVPDVALKLKLNVVSLPTSVGSPVIAPVDEFKIKLFVDKTVPPVSE
jgi:hypothetical protein